MKTNKDSNNTPKSWGAIDKLQEEKILKAKKKLEKANREAERKIKEEINVKMGKKVMRTEHQEQKAVVEYLTLLAVPHFAIPNGLMLGGNNKYALLNKFKAEGLKNGVPDLFIPVPNKFCHGLFIEMKTVKGKLQPHQALWKKILEDNHYYVAVCYGFEEAKIAIDNYLACPPE